MTVRSTVLAALAHGGGGFTGVYTVPEGIVVIVKEVDIYNGNAAQATVAVRWQRGGGATFGMLLNQALAAAAAKQLTCYAIGIAGDVLEFYSNQNAVQFWASGAALRTS